MAMTPEEQAEFDRHKAEAEAAKRKGESDARAQAELKQKLDAAEAKLRAEEEKTSREEKERLEKGNEFKTLFEREKAEKEDLRKKHENQQKAIVNREVRRLVLEEALRAGLKNDMVDVLSLIPLDGITPRFEVVGEDMTVSAIGVEQYVEALKRSKASLFGPPPAPGIDTRPSKPTPSVPADGGKVPSITAAELAKLKKDNPAEYAEKYGKALRGELSVV